MFGNQKTHRCGKMPQFNKQWTNQKKKKQKEGQGEERKTGEDDWQTEELKNDSNWTIRRLKKPMLKHHVVEILRIQTPKRIAKNT